MTVPALEMSWSCCSSTNRAVELGDRRWREVFEQYDATVRGELGDRVQLQPVALNLVLNGMDAMREPCPRDRVR